MSNWKYGDKTQWLVDHMFYEGDDCLICPFRRNTGYGWSRRMCEFVHGAPPFKRAHAAHSCGNGRNGCVNPRHLYWTDAKGNSDDKRLHGTMVRGSKQHASKLTEKQVAAILKDDRTHTAVAADYGVSRHTIGLIKSGKWWRHVTGLEPKKFKFLTDEQAEEIRKDPRPGSIVALDYGVSHSTICDIRKGRSHSPNYKENKKWRASHPQNSLS